MPNERLSVVRVSRAIQAGAVAARWDIDQAGVEFHAPDLDCKLLQLVLDFVERFLAEVAILEHLRFGFLRELADGGDVGVVQAIRRAHAELDLVHAHVEQLLQLHVFFAYSGRRFVELDHVLVEVDEDIEVMPQNRGRLEQARRPG